MTSDTGIATNNCIHNKRTISRRRTRALALAVSAAVGLVAQQALATQRTWSSSPTSNNWNLGSNWGGTVPGTGDSVAFGTSSRTTLNNDETAGLSLVGVTFNSGASGYTITGSSIALSGSTGLVDNATATETFDLGITLGSNQNVSVGTSGTLVLTTGVISDGSNTFGLNFTGPGTLRLGGTNTFKGGVTVNSGTLQVQNAAGMGTGTLTLAGGTLDLQNTSASAETYNNAVTVSNTATIDVDRTSTNTTSSILGALSIGSQTLNIANGSGIASGTAYNLTFGATKVTGSTVFDVKDNGTGIGTLTLGALSDDAIAHTITFQDTGAITLGSAATLTSGTAVTLGSGTTLNLGNATALGSNITDVSSSGTLALQAAANLRSLTGTGAVTLGGNALTLNPSTTTSNISGLISGTGGSIVMGGSGTLTLSDASNSYTGGTTINSGTVQASGAAALGTGTATIYNGGTLSINNVTAANAIALNNGGTLIGTGASATSSGVTTVGATASSVSIGTGSSTSDAFTLGTSGTPLVGGATTTTINVVGSGTLYLNLGSTYAGIWNIGNGATVNFGTGGNAFGTAPGSTVANYITLNGGTMFDNVNTFTFGSTRGIELGNAGGTIDVKSANSMTYAGTIADVPTQSGALTFGGPGTLILQGANTYSGGTAINGGTLSISADNNLGATGTALSMNGGTLNPTVSFSSNRNITLGSSGGTFNMGSGATLTESGLIGGTGGLTMSTGTGTLLLSGANTYLGTTTISSGVLQLGNASAVQNSTVSVGATNGLTFGTGLSPFTLGGLSGASNFALSDTGSSAVTINVGNNSANSTYSGVMSGAGGLSKIGTGTLTLSSANTYAGATSISAGTVQLGVANAIPGGAGKGDVTVNGTLDLHTFSETINGLIGSGTVDTVTGGTPTLTIGSNGDGGTFSGVIKNTAGTLALVKSGAGTEILSGANTYSGATTVSAGTLQLGAGNAIPSGTGKGDVTVNGTLDLNTFSATINGLIGSGTVDTVAGGTPVLTLGSNGDGGTFSGAIKNTAGTLSLIKSGAGTEILSGINTYTGGTTINGGGTLQIQADSGLGNASGALAIGGGTLNTTANILSSRGITLNTGTDTFNVNSGFTLTESGIIGSTGGLTKATGTGTLVLSNNSNSYGGGTTLSAGTLQVGAVGALGSGSVTLNGGTLDLATDNSVNAYNTTIGGTVTIASDRASSGAGITHTLGTLSIAAGDTLNLTKGANVSSSTAGLTFGTTTLPGSGTAPIFNEASGTLLTLGALSGASNLNEQGSGQLTLATASSNTSGTATLTGGTMVLGNTSALGSSAVALHLNGGTLDLATDSSVNPYSTTVGGTATIASDLAGSGGAITHTLGTLSIGANTLDLTKGANVASGIAGLTFGNTTLSANNAVFDTASGTNLTLGALSGNFSFTKQDTGTLTLNSVSGRTSGTVTLSGGTMVLGNASALGSTGVSLALNGGTLDLDTGTSVNAYGISGIGGTPVGIVCDSPTSVSSVSYTLGSITTIAADQVNVTKGANVTGTAQLTLGTVAPSAGGATFDTGPGVTLYLGAFSSHHSWTKQDSGTLIMNSPSIDTGATVTLAGGTMVLGSTSALGDSGKALAISSGTLDLATNTSITAYNTTISGPASILSDRLSGGSGITHTLGNLTINGSQLSVSAGSNVSANSAYGLAFLGTGTTTLSGNPTFDVADNGSGVGTLTLGALNDGGTARTITLQDNGAMVLGTAANTITAGTNFSIGPNFTLNLNQISDLGTTTGGRVDLNNSGALVLGANQQYVRSLTGSGSVNLNSYTLTVSPTTTTPNISGGISGSGSFVMAGTGAVTLSGNNSYGGTTSLNAGTTYLDGITSGQGNYSVGANAALGGIGTIGLANNASLSLTGTSASAMAILSPGDIANPLGTLAVTTSGTGKVTLGNFSELAIDINGANADALHVTGNLNTNSASNKLLLNMTGANQGLYPIATYTSLTSGANPFASVSGLDANYMLQAGTTELDVIHRGTIGTITASSPTVIVNGTVPFTFTVQNTAPTGGAALSFSASGVSNVIGSASGSAKAGYASDDTGGLYFTAGSTTGTVLGSFSVSDSSATNSPQTGSVSATVEDHASGSINPVSGSTDFGTVITQASVTPYVFNIGNASGLRAGLQVNSVAGSGSAGTLSGGPAYSYVVAAGGTSSSSYTFTPDTSTIGAYSATQTFTTGDDQNVWGHNTPSANLAVQVTGNVEDHASGTASVTAGDNFNAFVNTNLTATVNLAAAATDGSGADRAGLQVGGTSGNLSGGTIGVIGAGSSSNYTAAFNTGATAGAGGVQVSFDTGDDQSLPGAGSITTGNVTATITGSILDHAVVPDLPVTTPHVTQGQSVNFTYALSNLGGSANRDDAAVSSVSGEANGYASGFTVPITIASGGPSAWLTGTFTPTYGGPSSQQFSFTYGDLHNNYSGANNNNQTANVTVNGTVDALVEVDADSSNATAAGRPQLDGTSNINGGAGANRGYVSVTADNSQGTLPVLFGFVSDGNLATNLAALEADLTTFHYTWLDASGNYSSGDGLMGSGDTADALALGDFGLEVDAPNVLNPDPVVSFDFSKYGSLEVLDIATLSSLPEPSTAAMMALAGVGVLTRRRRRRTAHTN